MATKHLTVLRFMTKRNFEQALNDRYTKLPFDQVTTELRYLVDEKKVSEPTFYLYIRQRMTGTMIKRLDTVLFNKKKKEYELIKRIEKSNGR